MNRFISVLVDYIAFLLKTVLVGRQFIKIDLPVKLLEGFKRRHMPVYRKHLVQQYPNNI